MEYTVIFPKKMNNLYCTRTTAEFCLNALEVNNVKADSIEDLYDMVQKMLIGQWGDQTYRDILAYFNLFEAVKAAEAIKKLEEKSGCLLISKKARSGHRD